MLQEVPLVLRLNPADDVVIARRQLVAGTLIKSEGITVVGLIPPGHKVAARAIAAGQPVRRYNQIIGFTTREIRPGDRE
jgi:altronate hydrolase